MKVTRRVKITTTRRRTQCVQLTSLRALCPLCACEVETLASAQAAAVLEIDELALDGLIAAGRVHAIALVNGHRRICRNSLFD